MAGFGIGALWENVRVSRIHWGDRALEATGLPAETMPYSFAMEGHTGFRDYFEQTTLYLPYNRDAVLEVMGNLPLWRVASLTAEEFRAFQSAAMWEYAQSAQVADDTVFDAWYYNETVEPAGHEAVISTGALAEIGRVGRGFIFAAYDADSGYFIYVHQFG